MCLCYMWVAQGGLSKEIKPRVLQRNYHQVLSKSRTDSFATGLQKLVIKLKGGVTFYTSSEVQPVTAIMLKESVPSGQKKKIYEHVT